MSFLFPVALGGLVLVGVPILVHLIMRQKPQTLLFPAFRFLLQRHRTNLRKLRLRHFALLALRVLIFVALFLALAQPLLFSTGTGWSGGHPLAVVLVIDTSPRMGYQSAKKTRLTLAQEKAKKLLSELHPDTKVLILDGGIPAPSGKKGEKPQDWAASPSQASKLIDGLTLRDSSRTMGEQIQYGLARLDELARDPNDPQVRTLPRFLCVFSDRTRGSWKTESREDFARAVIRIPPTYEGLQAVQGDLPELIELVKELRVKLPGEVTYADQTLLDALNQLQGNLVSLTPEDVPFATKKLAPVPIILQQGRELSRTLKAGKGKSEDEPYRERVLQQLETVAGKLSGAQCLYFNVGLEAPLDLGVVRLETPKRNDGAPRQVFAPDEKWVLRAVARGSGKEQSATVLCKLPGETLEASVTIPADKETTVSFEIDNARLKPQRDFLQIEVGFKVADSLPFNNQRFLTVAIEGPGREPKRILVIGEEEKARHFVAALKALGYLPEVKTPEQAATLGRFTYPAVFLFQAPRPGKALWAALETYVAKGGALGVIPGGDEMLLQEGDADGYDGPIAKRILPGRIKSKVTVKEGVAWDLEGEKGFEHSLLRPFRVWSKANIDFIRFPRAAYRYWEVEPVREGQVLMRYADDKNRPALLELPADVKTDRLGKVLLFTTPLDGRDPPWNNYLESITSFYIVLAGLSANYLAGDTDEMKLNFTTDQAKGPHWSLPMEKSYLGYQLKGPGVRRDLSPPVEEFVLELPEAKLPGNYTLDGLLRGSKKDPVGAFSVNLSPGEGDLSQLDRSAIEDTFGPGSVLAMNHETEIRDLLKGIRNEPLKLLPILMLAVLFLLAGENLLANLFYRKDT